MATNTRTNTQPQANKTTAKPPVKKAPARKAPAKKSPTKRATAKAAPVNKTTAGPAPKPAAKTPAKKALPKTAPLNTVTVLHPQVSVRRKVFVGPLGANEIAAVRAALAAASAALPVPVRSWNGPQAQLADGLLLIHNPGPDRIFTANIACPHGAIHGWPIRTRDDLTEARAVTRICQTRHTAPDETTGLDWDRAITQGVTPLTQPVVKVSRLTEGLKTAKKAVADTQGLSRDDIDAALTNRADTETPKEHPQP
ncbi:hypothetical protein [Streptomyces collinus]|uniref:hypothetical protein n=1 Tax=Streptomyces collinus TaxID=42684 RepID=UPI00380E4878